jgi:hypothetical protein
MSGVVITGVWLRSTKNYPREDRTAGESNNESTDWEVLVEINGKWRKILMEMDSLGSGPCSHIVETAGIVSSPLDDLQSTVETRRIPKC